MSRGQVISLAKPDSTALIMGTSISDVLLILETVLKIFTEVEDEG
jgi:hypothetical protein